MGSVTKTLLAATLAALFSGAALASEDYDLRYAPGIGGADMSAPYEGGWVIQAPAYFYRGKLSQTATQVTDLTPFGVPGGTAVTDIGTRTTFVISGLLPRISYLSQEKFLGAQVGATALLPLINKHTAVSVTGVNTTINAPIPDPNKAALAAAINGAVTPVANGLAAADSDSNSGIGDLEISPIMRWSSDATQVMFVATVVMPTGDYHADRATNPSAGKFWTFRPAVQYSYIGDGWDFGTRVAFSVNTTNHETHYKTGNYLNIDTAFMKSLNDAWRLGLTGYGVIQTTRDTMDGLPIDAAAASREAGTVNQKGHVFGVGPEIAYIKGAGEYLLEGRVVKEFAADNRPEGLAVWATLSMPF